MGAGGQRKLLESRVLIVGCGGLGHPVVQYLAAVGVGSMTLADGDQVEQSNLNRQTLFNSPVVEGSNKALFLRGYVKRFNPHLKCEAIPRYLDEEMMRAEFGRHDLVVDCTDKLSTKFLLNDVSVTEDVPLIHGACTGTGGQMMVVLGQEGPCLRCLFEAEPEADVIHAGTQPGIFGATCGIVGSLMAMAAIKVLLSEPEPGISEFHLIDGWKNTIQSIEIESREGCVCGK